METTSSRNDLRSFLEAIKVSDVVENRTQLLLNLGELEITDKSEVACLVGELTKFWEDSICLDISQCAMNKAILQIAAKYLDTEISGASGDFLCLGMKASVWCGKHLKMTLMSIGESQEEEHSNLFYQVLKTLLSYSACIFSVSASSSASVRSELYPRIESFLSEVLGLTKDTLSAIRSMDMVGPEVQKVSQMVLEAVIQLCKAYCQGVDWSSKREEEIQVVVSDGSMEIDHAMKITKITVDKLCEVGFLAANDGGTLVGVLNVSWKGVVTLLQLGKGALAANLDVAGVIRTLISLANQALKCATDTWSLKLEEAVQLTEAKRIFLPVKFYLINAVRIISQYPAQAFSAHKEILRCVVLISSFKLYLSMGENLKFATEALGEILEPTSFHLLNANLNSLHAKQEEKLQVLEWLFGDEIDMDAALMKFNVKGADPTPSLGQVYLFLYFLRSSSSCEDHIKAWMARKLPWLLDILINEDVYNIILCVQVHMTHTSSQDQKPVYKPFLHCILDALKTFMVVMSSNSEWVVIEYFLLQNLIHPHFLCREIVNDLWCFILQHAETDVVTYIIDKLFLLLNSSASAESVINPVSALRQIARSVCLIVSCCSPAVSDQVYNFATGDGRHLHGNTYTAMLIEGFPLNLLPERTRSSAKQKIVSEYFCYIENFTSEQSRSGDFENYGAPVFALSATLHFKQVSLSDTEMKTLKFLVAVIEKYKNAKENRMKGVYGRLLSEGLGIISHLKNSFTSDDMEGVILELQKLFISKSSSSSSASDGLLFLCKPNLANFMSSLGHLEFVEDDDNLKCAAIWGLFHMLLREKHWAFAHLAMSAFGYFASHTSCSQLWRFVPDDAALSYDLDSGNEADEERFMSELKGFLDKHSSSLLTKPTPDHMAMLLAEGLKLKETAQRSTNVNEEAVTCDAMEIDEEFRNTRKRKLPDGISRGVELLQNGVKVMADEISQWQHNQIDQTEIQDKFLTHFSRLEDVVSNLASLAGDS